MLNYCRWYTHWGDDHWGHSDIKKSVNQVKFLVGHGYSFSIYMAHGGTSFGFWAGANMGTHYQPDITSYDYDSAITEAGEPTDRFHKIRELVSTYALWDIPDIP
jgi:beta-galactosidase